jgi:hypothetical protein
MTWDELAKENTRLKAERDELSTQMAAMREALEPFATFLVWLEAAVENGDIEPFDENTVVSRVTAGGGSMALHIANLQRAHKALSPSAG